MTGFKKPIIYQTHLLAYQIYSVWWLIKKKTLKAQIMKSQGLVCFFIVLLTLDLSSNTNRFIVNAKRKCEKYDVAA